MIDNSLIGVPLRAQIQGYFVGETQSGFPYLSISLRVIDANARDILNEREGSYFGPSARYYLVSSKTGKTNAFAVNSLRHLFPDWDDSLTWFENKPHVQDWYSVQLKANQDATGYDVEYLYPYQGQPYKLDRPEVQALANKWDKFLKAVPRQGSQQQQQTPPPPNQSLETNVLPKEAKKGDDGDDVPF